jgi:hypothetical protein
VSLLPKPQGCTLGQGIWPDGVPRKTRAIVGPVMNVPCGHDNCEHLDVLEEDTQLSTVLEVYRGRTVRVTIELVEAQP